LLELFRYRDLIRALIVRDLKVRYRRSAIGFLWTMLHPLATMLVLEVVFSRVFRFDIKDYPVYAFSGLLFWNFFSQSVVSSMNSLKGNAALLQKLPVPKAVFPIATVLSGVVNLLLALVPLLLIMLATHHRLCVSLLWLPISIAAAAVFTLGVGLILSPLAVFFSDVVEMVTVTLTLVLYLTPVFYPVSIVPSRYRGLVQWNPVQAVLVLFREPIYDCGLPRGGQLLAAVLSACGAMALGAATFQRSSDRIPFYL
jgi:homopolymeric O-antigen transport system permease protein